MGSSPYHPQGNGIVERLHGSLNSIIAKMVDKKGNWPEVVSMALYFVTVSLISFFTFLIEARLGTSNPFTVVIQGVSTI